MPKLFIIHSLPKKEITRTGYSTTKIFKSISHSLHPTGRIPWIILHLWEFLCIGKAGCKVTKSVSHFVIYPTEKWKPIVRSENITSTSAWLLLDKQVINKANKPDFLKNVFNWPVFLICLVLFLSHDHKPWLKTSQLKPNDNKGPVKWSEHYLVSISTWEILRQGWMRQPQHFLNNCE